MKVIVFVQSEVLDEIQAIELDPQVGPHGLRPALIHALPKSPEVQEMFLFLEDNDEEGAAADVAEIPNGLRVHFHRLKGIDVMVRYAGREVRGTFRPSATVGRVKTWATEDLGIGQSDAAELMLQVSGTSFRPDSDTHIGSMVKSPNKSLAFDLVPSPRVNG